MPSRQVPRREFMTVAGKVGGTALVFGGFTRVARATAAEDTSVVAAGDTVTAPPTGEVSAPVAEAAEVVDLRSEFGLQAGQRLGRWHVKEVGSVTEGAVPVVLQTAGGELFQLDVVRRERGMDGIANTRDASIFLVNNGTGDTVTDEEKGCGALMLGRHLESFARGGHSLPTELLTFSQRRNTFPVRELYRRRA